MRNLSIAGLETEASIRNRNFVKDAYFGSGPGGAWQLNGGVVPVGVVQLLNTDATLYTSSFPYSLTLPLLAAGGKPPYSWSILPYTPLAGKTVVPSGSISGNTLFGTYSAAASSQVMVQVTDSLGNTASKVLNVNLLYTATTPPPTTATTTPLPTTTATYSTTTLATTTTPATTTVTTQTNTTPTVTTQTNTTPTVTTAQTNTTPSPTTTTTTTLTTTPPPTTQAQTVEILTPTLNQSFAPYSGIQVDTHVAGVGTNNVQVTISGSGGTTPAQLVSGTVYDGVWRTSVGSGVSGTNLIHVVAYDTYSNVLGQASVNVNILAATNTTPSPTTTLTTTTLTTTTTPPPSVTAFSTYWNAATSSIDVFVTATAQMRINVQLVMQSGREDGFNALTGGSPFGSFVISERNEQANVLLYDQFNNYLGYQMFVDIPGNPTTTATATTPPPTTTVTTTVTTTPPPTTTAAPVNYTLTVTGNMAAVGLGGTPEIGTYVYPAGTVVDYSYSASGIFDEVAASIDGNVDQQGVDVMGTVTMDGNHTLNARGVKTGHPTAQTLFAPNPFPATSIG
jgi:hypothetical protein